MRGLARSGFTLVEMMIVIALIGILSAIAITRMSQMQLQAKRAEPVVNLQGIAAAETAYEAAFDAFIECDNNPARPLTKRTRAWDPALTGWEELGWGPDGDVRCNYRVGIYGGETWFRADAHCDIDNNNEIAILRWYSAESGQVGILDLYPKRF